ncbi:heme/hemin ABC transporter substrate-binding protein [Microbacterium halotolerans]|uniref:heme/hemin ABC transporter substrate-binding protein n=1 Tax=Microbacterium halotolerans TaxID=246613 RepID=UPI000E6AA061|nr:ABC transporter substrate-binding protein [Microbacterium halotolerans]
MSARLRATIAAIALAGVFALAACGPDAEGSGEQSADAAPADLPPLSELDVLDDPRDHVGESTAALQDVAISPVVDDPQQSLPATVTSHDANGEVAVEVTDTSRVVAIDLAGSLAATVWGLGFGDTLVGRDQATTFPGTQDLEQVTSGGHTVNAEAVIALEPDVVITDGTVGPVDVVEQLRDVGITVVFVENEPSFDGAASLAEQVAAVFGAPEAGDLLAESIRTGVDETIADIAEIAPSGDERLRVVFLYLRGSAGVYYLFGSESGADQLIDALGGIDVVSELGWEGMQPMTDEALVAADPDLILVMSDGIESVGGVEGLLAEKPAVALTTAGENRRFVDMDDGTILSFGPRSSLVLDALARAIYAPEDDAG